MQHPLNIANFDSWLQVGHPPLVISGPCSAESEKQLLQTASALSRIRQVKVFRAGIWKPRTRPDLFEGVGNKGLEWLNTVREETGLLTAVEVATGEHIERSLKAGIDILWIGARTVMNPFSVQEISGALQGCDIPVMIKNPVSPDINTWIGSIERINLAGITKLAAIHRGFYCYNKSIFRNTPMWDIPIELKRLFPVLPVICDPSHISGRRDLIPEIAQKALDLEMNGLMIESHIDPDNALTDAAQQLSPKDLRSLLNHLEIRKKSGDETFKDTIQQLRGEIDMLDSELLNILARRIEVVKKIGENKKLHQVTILQLKRWQEIIQDRLEKGARMGLREEFLVRILNLIHQEMIDLQNQVMNNEKNSNDQVEPD